MDGWIRRLDGVRLWGVLFACAFVVYALTATYGLPQSIDTVTTAVQAHQIAVTGSPVLEGLDDPGQQLARQLREGREGTVTDRHPGSVAAGVVGYLVASPWLPGFESLDHVLDVPLWPATLMAVFLAAAAVATIGLALTRLPGVSKQTALGAAVVFAFGTGTWSVSANALWTHSVAQLGITVAIAGFVAKRWVWAGVGWAIAITARLHTAVIAAAAGVAETLEQRRLRPMIVVGVLSLGGLVLAMGYGLWVFGGEPSLTVGRGTVTGRIGYGSEDATLGVVGNLVLVLVHPVRGLLPMAPFLIPLLLVLREGWRRSPGWVRGLTVGAVAQLMVQGAINDFSGGVSFFGSRITLEFLTATVPLWVLAYSATEEHPRIRQWTHVLAGASIIVHLVGATVMPLGHL